MPTANTTESKNRILSLIEEEISKIDKGLQQSNVGTITKVGDGVVYASGLSKVMFNEVLELPNNVKGIALNLEEDRVGCIVFGDVSELREGDSVKTTGHLLSIPVGKAVLGRVVDALGNPIDGKGSIAATEYYPIERMAPGIIERQSVDQPLQTGIAAIDAMIPIGRGQRELIIGDRSTGKTTLAIDTMINQARINDAGLASKAADFRPVYSIYVAIGQKNATVARTIKILEEAKALPYTVIVNAPAADNPANQYIAPYAGTSIGEWFMQNGMDAMIIYDDLSKHAVAYRQISLILKRPSGREAYPGDVFYLHSRLLERSARLNPESGGGSLTALPIIETQAGDVSAYIPTNVISITDGQIFLETDLFNQGIRPAISVGLSVSRVGSAAQIKALKQVAGKIKLELAQFRELAAFAQFGADLDAKTKGQLERGARIVEIFKQGAFAPRSVALQVITLWAIQHAYFDATPVSQISQANQDLETFITTHRPALIEIIDQQKAITPAAEEALKEALNEWKRRSL